MPNNYTTLSVSREFAQKIQRFDGATTEDRLKNWADQYDNDSDYMTELEVESLIEQKIEDAMRRH